MNKIGFNTLVWSAVVSDDLFPIIDELKKIGYDGVECFIGAPDEKAYQRFGAHANSIGLETTSVFVVDKEQNPVDPSSQVRQRALDRIKWGIDRAHAMQSTILCGPFHSAHGIFTKKPPFNTINLANHFFSYILAFISAISIMWYFAKAICGIRR